MNYIVWQNMEPRLLITEYDKENNIYWVLNGGYTIKIIPNNRYRVLQTTDIVSYSAITIATNEILENAEMIEEIQLLVKPKTYIVDIDGTICTIYTNHKEYHKAEPYYDRIKKINDLYDEGHTIIYWTARGSRSGVDCRPLTEKQLTEWGCKYTELKMEVKPFYDFWIDDKCVNDKDFFSTI